MSLVAGKSVRFVNLSIALAALFAAATASAQSPQMPSNPVPKGATIVVPKGAENFKIASVKLETQQESPLTCANINNGGAAITVKLTNSGNTTFAPGDVNINVTLSAAGESKPMSLTQNSSIAPGEVFHGIINGQPSNRYILSAKAVADYMKSSNMTRPPSHIRATLTFSPSATSKVKVISPSSPMHILVPVVMSPDLCGYLK